jgi:nucleotide-binding universal stress UspA family protein
MYKHILVATDGSDLAAKAVTQALGLAKALGAKVTAVTVSEPWTTMVVGEAALAFPVDEYEKAARANAEKALAGVKDAAAKAGMALEAVHVPDQFPAEGILSTAKNKGCDLIVMASHGRRGLSRLLLGSQAVAVVTNSTIPVLVCR